MTHRADIIDLLAGLKPDHPLTAVRDLRPAARENAQRSFEALLEPADPRGFTYAERYAVAAFVGRLHGSARAADFYADLLGDADPGLAPVVDAAARGAVADGPTGVYREPGLASESVVVDPWTPDAATRDAVGTRLAAALAHAHLLVIRPREASPDALRALGFAGWTPDQIVSLSQLVAFLAFQLRVVRGLAVLSGGNDVGASDAPRPAEATATPTSPAPAAASDGSAAAAAPDADPVADPADLARPHAFTQEGLGWVPWLAPVAEDDLDDVQRAALVEPARARMPYFRLLARDPAALEARTLTDLDIFFNVSGGIGRAERELAAAATSRANGCVFCASVHAAAATRESGRRDDVQRLLDDGTGAPLGDATWDAVAAASVALAATPLRFGDADVAGLRGVGLDDAEIVDVVNGAAFFNWANRLMLSLGEPEVPASRRGAGA